MILSLVIGAVFAVIGTMLLFHAKHLNPLRNKDIALQTVGGFALLVVAFLCGAISGVLALNTPNLAVVVIGAIEASASAIVGVSVYISWMDADINEGHPSN